MAHDPTIDAVPDDLVAAGAPPSFADWNAAQLDGYLRGDTGELIEGETPIRLDAWPIADWPAW